MLYTYSMDAKFFRKEAEEDAFDIRIDYNGTWYHQGRPIERERLAKLFSTVLHYDADKREYWLVTPVEQGRVEVEDAPYIVTDFKWDEDHLTLITNLGHEVQPSTDHPIYVENEKPYVVADNHVPARINRATREKLIDIALSQNGYNESDKTLTLTANGHEHIIARS